jgi:hypothetical protein
VYDRSEVLLRAEFDAVGAHAALIAAFDRDPAWHRRAVKVLEQRAERRRRIALRLPDRDSA